MIESGALETFHCLDPFAAAIPVLVRENATRGERVAAVQSALGSAQDAASRDRVADWLAAVLPAERLVPDAYARWRPLVAGAIAHFLSRLSPARLAPKLVEQFEMPANSPVEVRLSRLIASIPALQKAGQILSRNNRIDPALRRELSQLEDAIRDVEFSAIQEIVHSELGPLLDRFEIALHPGIVSEATVSAVVSFTWRNPATDHRERGVLKVLKPSIPEHFGEELAVLEETSRYLDTHPQGVDFAGDLPGIFGEIGRALQREIDFPHEQLTLVEARRTYQSVPGMRVPRLIAELSTARITAMSEEVGIKITKARHLEPHVRRRVTDLLIDALIARPFFSPEPNAMFHADPHPGNLFYDEQAREIVLLDWAMTERLGRNERRRLAMLGIFILLRDGEGVVRTLRALARDSSPATVTIFEQRTWELLARRQPGLFPVLADLTTLLDQLAFDGVRFPPSLLIFRKMLFTLDGVLRTVAGADVVADFTLFRDQLARWIALCSPAAAPLTAGDWIAAQWSALRTAWRDGAAACLSPWTHAQ